MIDIVIISAIVAGKEIKPNITSKLKIQKRQITSERKNDIMNCKTTDNMIIGLFFMVFFIVRTNVIVPTTKTTEPRYKFNNKCSMMKINLDYYFVSYHNFCHQFCFASVVFVWLLKIVVCSFDLIEVPFLGS